MKIATISCARRLCTVLLSALTITAAAGAQPAFDKSFNPSTIGPGSVSTLTFTITNNDLVLGATGLAFTDTLPAGMTIASPSNASTNCDLTATVSAPDGGTTISLSDGRLPPNSSCTVTVDVSATTTGTNTSGDLTSSLGNSGTASATLTVDTGLPGFSKSFSPSSVFFGGRSTLTFTIDNTANPSAVVNLDFTDNLPIGMIVASPSNAVTDCEATNPALSTTLTATSGSSVIILDANGHVSFPVLAAGATCTVTVDVVGNAIGVLGNTTNELLANFVSAGKAAATLTVSVEQIALEKSFIGDPVAPGDTVTLAFTIRNLDRRASATDIAFTDDLNATLSGLAVTGSLPTSPCGGSLTGTSFLTFSGGGSLAPEASCTFSVTLQVPAAAAAGGYTNTTSSITADFDGSPATGNPASDILFVQAVPLLTKEFIPNPVGAGDTVTLRFTITNTSTDSTATDIAFVDELTTFLPFPVSATLPSTPCGASSSISLVVPDTDQHALSLTGGELAANGTCTFDVDIDIPEVFASGTYTNTTGEITATVGGETVTGGGASDDLLIVAAPGIEKQFVGDPVNPGDTVTLVFT
ncbi:MAG: DUF11 domain-containing protein, partial [Actinomycetia bacterium]|nr:DUF11 domain-containing protein [Actinomycetes bacterium]